MLRKTQLLSVIFLLVASFTCLQAGNPIKGIVRDAKTNEPLFGVTVQVEWTTNGSVTDFDGYYEIKSTPDENFILNAKYIGYKDAQVYCTVGQETADIFMETEELEVEEVQVVAQKRTNNDVALLKSLQSSLVVESGVSGQDIKRTQDKDASEVVRRIPGISIIDGKFVMVRGLSQRYNNVWINMGSVPSSEADSRAFSFDIIPSSQIDNMIIVKSPTPEYPADFTGGFILIKTKDVPNVNSWSLGFGGNFNTQTHGRDFLQQKTSATDWLGFDNGLRKFDDGIHQTLKGIDGVDNSVDLLGNGFNNDWTLDTKTPVSDVSANATVNHAWYLPRQRQISLLGSVNISNSRRRIKDMKNNLFGAYDTHKDQSNYLRESTDQQYNVNARVGAMLNTIFNGTAGKNRIEFKNIFNQIGTNRYTYREGYNAQLEYENTAEYYYSSRLTYNGQLAGNHRFDNSNLDWNIGYAYSNRNLPDRKRYVLYEDGEAEIGLVNSNDIDREFTHLSEHIASFGVNYDQNLAIGSIMPTLKLGAFGEIRDREFYARYFIYNWNASSNTLPEGFRYMDLPTELFVDENYGADRLYMLEDIKWRNNYEGNNKLIAGYAALSIPVGKFNAYLGVRYENNSMTLTSHRNDAHRSPRDRKYETSDFFPSANLAYRFTEKQVLRAAYGRSINRMEFREVSPFVYYDFEIASNVQGNTELEECYVNNVDFRYEWYPSAGETVSFSVFYKHFDKPIEWTYTVAGGTDLVYSYENAKEATSVGIELEARKNLDFIAMPCFNISANLSIIDSDVDFTDNAIMEDRPMQGQSPYLVNIGLFYTSKNKQLTAGAFYNRIGKRIIGVGRSDGVTSEGVAVNIPHSYEMPRDVVDLSASYKFNDMLELRLSIRDLLAQDISFEQQTKATFSDGHTKEVNEVAKQYKPGTNIGLSLNLNF